MKVPIFLKSTIAKSDDDWCAASFSTLAATLRAAGAEVVARDRAEHARPDPDLLGLAQSDFDQLWLFGLDGGDSLMPGEAEAIEAFRQQGGGLLLTRDHNDMGRGFVALGAIGKIHHFHSANPEPDLERQRRDDQETENIDWPNYHSGANGDAQKVEPVGELHPIAARENGAPLRFLPAHPHEGALSVPSDLSGSARVVLQGRSKVSGRPINTAIAVDERASGASGAGRVVCDSSFHHFADYNLDPSCGCPSFVSEQPSTAIRSNPEALSDAAAYAQNIAAWLGPRVR